MTPILFDGNSKEFNSNGLGRLSDCTSCLVTEERNGIYECEFVYPIIGAHYKDIDLGKIIVVTHDDRRDKQPFIIYRRSAPISGMVVFNAHHVSYLLSNVIIRPFSSTTVSGTFTGFKSNAITANPFTFWTNKSSSGTFSMSVPSSCRSMLAGREGSVLDSFGGGDYEFDGYAVKLYANRGNDSGVTIRYGKNMTDLSAETDTMSLYTAVVPYWVSGDESVYGGVVYGNGAIRRSAYWTDENGAFITDENGEQIEFQYDEHKIVTMDLSSYFETAPTAEQLESRAQVILNANRPWIPTTHIKVDFVSLWQTEEYKNIAPLERVRLCDTVTVKYAELGVDVKARVIKTVWNPMLDRYDSIEIGDAQMSFADTIAAETDMKLADIPNTSMMQKAIDHATDLITGGLGGNIVIQYDGNGKPTEILVMDTEDVSTAVHVLRINVNGIGFSSSGIEGPYTSAWTLDGQFVADFITAGHMRFNILQGGELTLGGVNDGNGTLFLLNENGDVIVTMDNTGVVIDGALTANNATIKGTIRNEKGDEWFFIDESVATGGYGNSTDGLLDLSALTSDGATISYDVALEAITGNLREKAQKYIEIESTTGDIYLDVANGKTINVGYGGTPYQIVDTSGDNNTEKIRHLYRITSHGTTYLGITNVSGSTLLAELTASDEKLKTNIEDAGDVGLKAINKIEHKSFDFIDGGYHRECGYIAQQLQEAIPYSTIAAPECDENGNQTGELLQIVDHEVLVYATKAIQELSAKVEELERRLQEV